jgi:hypothetical protein
VKENLWIKEHLSVGRQVGRTISPVNTHHARHCGSGGLLLIGDALWPGSVFSSGVMLALKSGVILRRRMRR